MHNTSFRKKFLVRMKYYISTDVDDIVRPVSLPFMPRRPETVFQQNNTRPHTPSISWITIVLLIFFLGQQGHQIFNLCMSFINI